MKKANKNAITDIQGKWMFIWNTSIYVIFSDLSSSGGYQYESKMESSEKG